MSLRAIGEGHISSIEFRSGVIGADRSIRIDEPSRYAVMGDKEPYVYDKSFFATKLLDKFWPKTSATVAKAPALAAMP